MITIRNYRPEDYPQVSKILKQAELYDTVWDSRKNVAGMVAHDPKAIQVAVENDIIVGQLFIIPFGSKMATIFRLAVKKEFRKQGIATKLIEKAEDILRKRGLSEIGLFVDAVNADLQEFYKKRKFQVSKRPYYYMWKELKKNHD